MKGANVALSPWFGLLSQGNISLIKMCLCKSHVHKTLLSLVRVNLFMFQDSAHRVIHQNGFVTLSLQIAVRCEQSFRLACEYKIKNSLKPSVKSHLHYFYWDLLHLQDKGAFQCCQSYCQDPHDSHAMECFCVFKSQMNQFFKCAGAVLVKQCYQTGTVLIVTVLLVLT